MVTLFSFPSPANRIIVSEILDSDFLIVTVALVGDESTKKLLILSFKSSLIVILSLLDVCRGLHLWGIACTDSWWRERSITWEAHLQRHSLVSLSMRSSYVTRFVELEKNVNWFVGNGVVMTHFSYVVFVVVFNWPVLFVSVQEIRKDYSVCYLDILLFWLFLLSDSKGFLKANAKTRRRQIF
jgi:hypothetical protein